MSDVVAREAYAQEVSSLGFWPGNAASPTPLYYSYAYPEPAGFADAQVRPNEASYLTQLHEFILPYDAVRTAADPDAALLEFAQSTYDAASSLGKWDRAGAGRSAAASASLVADERVVGIAVEPPLVRLSGGDHGMTARARMFARVLVR